MIQKVAAAWAARDPNAIVVVTGDHGESFWEHGSFGHGTSLCDEQVRVPLVMCVPGTTATRYTYSSHADIFATIFDFMDLRTGGGPFMAGKSLLKYDPSRDIALFGYGLTGSEYDDRLGVAGEGVKVVSANRAPFATIAVSRDGDAEVRTPLPPDIESRAQDLKLRAVEARILR
jgi:membrane-anchored protein YejM (alkaline phosphatase superfamily)